MSILRSIDKRIIFAVLSPLARAALSALVGYLSARGVPSEMVEQVAAVTGGAGIVVFNVCWELLDRKRAEIRAAARVLGELRGDAA